MLIVYRPTNHVYVKYKELLTNNQFLHAKVNQETLNFVNTPSQPQQTKENNRCEVIHIGLVCSGYKSNLYLHVMLKSIFFYRNNPIHFHIVVNGISEKVLKILFDTWAIPQG